MIFTATVVVEVSQTVIDSFYEGDNELMREDVRDAIVNSASGEFSKVLKSWTKAEDDS